MGKGTAWRLSTLRLNNLGSFGPHPFPGFGSHRDPFALETFHQFDLQPLLFQALQVLPDEAPNVITWRAKVRSTATLFDELFQVFWKRDRHGACLARHKGKNIY